MEIKDSLIKELEFLTGVGDGSRIVCWFSHGIASTVATKLTILANNKLKTPKKLVVADIYLEEEHKDNIRFYSEVKEWLLEDLSPEEVSRIEFTTLKNEKYQGSVDNVINTSRYMSGIYGAMCTSVLKKEVRYEWQKPNDVHVFGMTVEEQNRIDRLLDGEADILVFAPLIEQGLTKMDCFDWFDSSNIKPPIMYELGFNNNNCFHGEEQFITDEGFKTFKDVVGESFNVVTRDGWKKGIVKHFGKQELMKLTLSRGANTKDVLVTPNHRWILPKHNHYSFGYKEVNTQELKVGDFIPSTFIKSNLDFDVEGVRHGFVFGDGTLYNKKSGNTLSKVAFCGDKVDLFKYFEGVLSPSNYLHGLPSYYKELPDECSSKEYLLGFIIGLVASDGVVSKSGVIINQVDKGVILQLEEIVSSLGMLPSLNSVNRDTNFKANSTLYSLNIPKSCFKLEWLLRDFHKNRFGDKRTNPKSWKVVGLERTGLVDDVYCLQVEGEYKEFTLKGGILTGNCKGCLKAGGAGYWNLTRKLFKDLFDERARQEEWLGVALVKMAGNVILNKHREAFYKMTEDIIAGSFPELKVDGKENPPTKGGKPQNCTLLPKHLSDGVEEAEEHSLIVSKINYPTVLVNTYTLINKYPEVFLKMLQYLDENNLKGKMYGSGVRIPLRYLPEDAGDQKSIYVGDCGFFCERGENDN